VIVRDADQHQKSRGALSDIEDNQQRLFPYNTHTKARSPFQFFALLPFFLFSPLPCPAPVSSPGDKIELTTGTA